MNFRKNKKLIQKDSIRVKKDYICSKGHFIGLVKIKPIKYRKPHNNDNLSDNCKEKMLLL